MSWGCAVGSRASWAGPPGPVERPRPLERPLNRVRVSWSAPPPPPLPDRKLERPLERPLNRPRSSYTDRTLDTPVEPPRPAEPPQPLERPVDRIFSAFDRTNSFQCVRRDSSERTIQHADVVVNRRTSMSLESADCALAGQSPADDDDYWKEKAAYAQQRQLFPLQEDLAEWINNTIGTTHITGENFLSALDNGAELCLLAAAIHDRAREAIDQGLIVGPVPPLRGRCWQRAARRSFYSRDNTENFITFCRELGVHDNLLFESDDLVLHHQPRQVILCLLEVARLAARYGLEPPGLVQLEREIALEEEAPGASSCWQFRDHLPLNDKSAMEVSTTSPELKEGESSVDIVDHTDAESTHSGGTVASNDSDEPLRPTNELDKQVQLVSRLLERGCRCGAGRCSKLLKVKKVGEGRYNIAGRNVFIRLLKGRHMMVRVGGGWDTLEHFLSRHEPCQVRLVAARRHSPTPTATTRSGKTTPVDKPQESGKTSPVDKDLIEKKCTTSASSGKISPVDKNLSGKTSPVDAKRPTSATSGKITPVNRKDRRASVNVVESRSSNVSERSPLSRRSSTPVAKSRSSVTLPLKNHDDLVPSAPVKLINTKTRAGLNLPLKEAANLVPVGRRKQSAPSFSTPTTPRTPNKALEMYGPKKSRSMSLAHVESKPFCGTERLNGQRLNQVKVIPSNGPKKSRSMSLALETKFCGTERLNQAKILGTLPRKSQSLASTPEANSGTLVNSFKPRSMSLAHPVAKKTRSMSLAHPIDFKPLSNKSISVTITGPMTQAAIEESIRLSLAATIVDCDAPKRPFLHIKAKYRSPPPREVPPR